MFLLASLFFVFVSVAETAGHIRATKTQKLRLCNAYPGTETFTVMLDKTDILAGKPIKYKECTEVSIQLKAGDRLDFQGDNLAHGSFTVGALSKSDSMLALVVSRQDKISTALSFMSHVFVPSKNAQVAVMDTFRGTQHGRLVISEPMAQKAADDDYYVYGEDLPYDSAVGVKKGFYEVMLVDKNNDAEVAIPVVIADSENYVVIRCGLDAADFSANKSAVAGLAETAEKGKANLLQRRASSSAKRQLSQASEIQRYPQDVFVYPNPTKLEEKEPKVEKAKAKEDKSAAIATPASLLLMASFLALQL